MKKVLALLSLGLLTIPAAAQLAGLPCADSASRIEAHSLRLSGGGVIGENENLYGGRVTYGLLEDLAIFADLGMVEPDYADSGLAYQGGAKLTLPFDLPVDLALRAAVGMTSLESRNWDIDVISLSGSLLASKDFERLSPYVFLGMDYKSIEAQASTGSSADDTETNILVGGGLLYSLSKNLSLYGEAAWVEDPYFSAGARWQF